MNNLDKAIFAALCKSERIPRPVLEYRFHPKRKWRFDYAWPDQMLAVEVEGGVWTKGRHVRGKGYINDMEKYNAAMMLGWRLLRFTPEQIKETGSIRMIKEALREK